MFDSQKRLKNFTW